MCGIAGFFSNDINFEVNDKYRKILVQMKKSLYHRGPDDSGIYLKEHCGFAHTRLAIRDVKYGRQPMKRTINNNDYVIVYNGEIYNTDILRKELKRVGWHFESKSDTEVILLLFLQYGPEFVKKIDGIFSFAIYDSSHAILYLYRDQFGIKPLFYTFVKEDNAIVFGSEVKALFEYGKIDAVVDRDGLNEVFGVGPARQPGNAVFKGIKELKPGNYLTYSKYGVISKEYWRLESRYHEDSYERTIEKTKYLLEDAVVRQMVSDDEVPICTFLSGGIDSSLVSSICAAKLKEEGKRLSTYSFDFAGNEKYFKANSFQPSQDAPYAKKMVDYLGTEHKILNCDYEIQANLLYESIDSHDLPCMADIDSSLIFFCREVSKKHKVVLTGECADEIFGGYPWFHREKFLKCNTFPWTPDLSPRKQLMKPDVLEVLNMDEYVKKAYESAVKEVDILPWENKIEADRRRISYLNIRFFMQTLLNRMDRTSMHSGLEARVPFADKQLVQYVFNIPWDMKARNDMVKNVLRQAARGRVPNEVLFRKKSPYPKTYNPYYEKLLINRLKNDLKNGAPILQIIDEKKLTAFMEGEKDYGAPWYGQLMAGPQMLAYLIQINYWLNKYKIKIQI